MLSSKMSFSFISFLGLFTENSSLYYYMYYVRSDLISLNHEKNLTEKYIYDKLEKYRKSIIYYYYLLRFTFLCELFGQRCQKLFQLRAKFIFFSRLDPGQVFGLHTPSVQYLQGL